MEFHYLQLLGYLNLEIMHQIRNHIFFIILITVFSSCIEPYSPNYGGQTTPKFVVYGQITDQEGYQTVSISKSSTIGSPKYNPLSYCAVKITDSNGNTFNLNEFEAGNYRVWMAQEFLNPGTSYQVDILNSSGVEILSDFDQMPESSEIDSIYYIRKDIPTTNPQKPLKGVQFYVDLDARNTNSHFYRWEITETWEHHAAYPKIWYWNMSSIIKVTPPDFSKFYCWSTQKIGNIYTLSTENLIENRYKMLPFHFVDNLSQRLTYCYSLLVNQFGLSEPAFRYWDKLRINSNDQGGLYGTQPLRIKGNLKSTTNPDLEILGFFSASSKRTKRIFVRNVENLELYYLECGSRMIERGDLNKEEPVYLIDVPEQGLRIIEDLCVECNKYGGSLVKPDYWPY